MPRRVALITGPTSGIGEGFARRYAADGYDLVLVSRDADRLKRLAAELHNEGGRAVEVLPADLAESADRGKVAERLAAGVDVLVNNAGVAITGVREEDFDRGIAVNLKSAFLCTEALLPAMSARRWGRIVNISSGAARGPGLLGVVYNASTAGLEGLTRGYASRTAKDGITVNAIARGPTDTEMGAPLKAGGVEARIPVGRMGQGEDVAQATVMVIGNGFITGQTIAVNGGLAFL